MENALSLTAILRREQDRAPFLLSWVNLLNKINVRLTGLFGAFVGLISLIFTLTEGTGDPFYYKPFKAIEILTFSYAWGMGTSTPISYFLSFLTFFLIMAFGYFCAIFVLKKMR